MKFNKRLAASLLTVVMALVSANLPVLAADTEISLGSEVAAESEAIEEEQTESDDEDNHADDIVYGCFYFNENTQMITGYYDDGNDNTDIVIPSEINGIAVLGIGEGAFIREGRFETIVIEEGIQTIETEAFKYCDIGTVYIPSTVTEIKYKAFYSEGMVSHVYFAENSNLTTIGELAFAYCDLQSIRIPASVTTVGKCAFKSCEGLNECIFEGDAPENIDSSAFAGYLEDILTIYYYEGKTGFTTPYWLGYFKCEMISTSDYRLIVDESTGKITGYIDNVEPVYSGNRLQNPQDLIIPNNIDGIEIIGVDEEAFIGWERLGSVTIENGVEYIGVSAFQDCVNLETLFIPNTVTYIDEYAFYGASYLEKVEFEENSNLAVISWMAFASCGLEEITIPESVTNIHEKAFRNCKYLERVYFEGNAPQNLEEDENAFSNCSSYLVLYYYEGKTGYSNPEWIGKTCLMISMRTSDYGLIVNKGTGRITGYIDYVEPVYSDGILQNPQDVIIPSNIDGTDITGVDTDAFAEWERIGSVTIENGVEYIGMYAFEKCVNLKSAFIPNTVIEIDSHAFQDATSLENVTFEEDSRLKYMCEYTFSNTAISEIIIPASVTNMYGDNFRNCKNLKKVYFEGDEPNNLEEEGNAFVGCSSDLVLYFYEGSSGYATPTWLGCKCVMISTSAEAKTWNFSDDELNSLGTITSNTTFGDLTILANSINPVQVKENARTLDGVKYDYCLSLRGKGNTDYRAVKIDVTRDCTISIAAASNDDSRSLTVVKEDGTVLGTIAAGKELSVGSVEYTGRVDSLYIYSEKDNVNIYSVNVSYNEV